MPAKRPERFAMRGKAYVPRPSNIKPLINGTRRLTKVFETNQAQTTQKIAAFIERKKRIIASKMPDKGKTRAIEIIDNQIKHLGQEKGRLIDKYERLHEPLLKSAVDRLKTHPDYPNVFSKTYFLEEMRDRLKQPGPHTVGMLDIDKLNKFLGKYYHEPTGRVVSIFTESVAHVLKPIGGFACLYGGDEVGVFIPKSVIQTHEIIQAITKDFKKRLAEGEFGKIAHTPEVQNLAFSGIFQDFTWERIPGMSNDAVSIFAHIPRGIDPETVFHDLSNGVIRMKKVNEQKRRFLFSPGTGICRHRACPAGKPG